MAEEEMGKDMERKSSKEAVLQWLKVAAAFCLFLTASFLLFQVLKEERGKEILWEGLHLCTEWARKIRGIWKNQTAIMGLGRRPVILLAVILLCGFWTVWEEGGRQLLLLF